MSAGLRLSLAATLALIACPAAAQETSSLARPEPDIPVIWLAPPPAPEAPPEDRQMPMLTLFLPPPTPASQIALPPAAKALLMQAMQSGNADSFAAVAKLAKSMYPDGGGQVDALSAENDAKIAEKKAADARAKADALAQASFLDNWKGEIDLGGSYTKGTSDAVSVYGAFKLNKEGLHWRHALSGRADYARSAGVLSTDKDTAAYQAQYKFNDRFYAYGLAQFDRDEILGFASRFTESPGFGYTVLPGPRAKLDLEAGPALRETDYIDGGRRQTRAAARGSVNFLWKPNGIITVTEIAALYVESDDNDITSTTTFDAKLFGPLKGRLTYNLTYEQDTPSAAKNFDTITTASLVFTF